MNTYTLRCEWTFMAVDDAAARRIAQGYLCDPPRLDLGPMASKTEELRQIKPNEPPRKVKL